MSGLAFRCAYTRREDKDGASPCRRPAVRRRHGESRCLGHWVAHWFGGDIKSTRLIYGAVFAVSFLAMVGQLENTVRGGFHEPVAVLAVMIGMACWSGGCFAAVVREYPFGGWLWFVATPFLAVSLAASAATLWFTDANSFLLGSVGGSRLGRALVALYCLGFAVSGIIEWFRFGTYVRGLGQGRDYLRLLGDVLVGALLVVAAVLAVESRGTESYRIVYLAVVLGAIGVARSARRITEFVRRFRI